MRNDQFSAREIAEVLNATRRGDTNRMIVDRFAAAGRVTKCSSVRGVWRRWHEWPADEAAIQQELERRAAPYQAMDSPLAGKSREEYRAERLVLATRVAELTKAGKTREQIGAIMGVGLSRVVYLLRCAVYAGIIERSRRSRPPGPHVDDHSRPKGKVYPSKPGPCLMCGKTIERTPINKVCGRCKQTDAWLGNSIG